MEAAALGHASNGPQRGRDPADQVAEVAVAVGATDTRAAVADKGKPFVRAGRKATGLKC